MHPQTRTRQAESSQSRDKLSSYARIAALFASAGLLLVASLSRMSLVFVGGAGGVDKRAKLEVKRLWWSLGHSEG